MWQHFREVEGEGLTSYAKFAFGRDYNTPAPRFFLLTKQLMAPITGENNTPRMCWWESWDGVSR